MGDTTSQGWRVFAAFNVFLLEGFQVCSTTFVKRLDVLSLLMSVRCEVGDPSIKSLEVWRLPELSTEIIQEKASDIPVWNGINSTFKACFGDFLFELLHTDGGGGSTHVVVNFMRRRKH